MIEGNIHQGNKGRRVAGLDTQHRRHAADFPGWGADNYADYLLPIPAGLAGVVTSVESHGHAPHTRYSVRFDDGSSASGLAEGVDIKFADEHRCAWCSAVRPAGDLERINAGRSVACKDVKACQARMDAAT